MAGRKTKLTKEVIENVCAAISLRAPEHVAARYAGIGVSTFYLYKAEGEKARQKKENEEELTREDKIYLEFLEGLEDAKANAIIQHLNVVNNAASSDPVWADRMLKVWLPDVFNPPQRHEITGSQRVILLLKENKVTLQEVVEDLGEAVAREIITEAMGEALAQQLFNSITTATT